MVDIPLLEYRDKFLALVFFPQTDSVRIVQGILCIFVAVAIGLTIGLLAAIWMSEYASKRTQRWLRNLLLIQAAVPPTLYGFGLLLAFENIGHHASWLGNTFLLGTIGGLMAVPQSAALMDDALRHVPKGLKNAAYALGAARGQTAFRVVLPSALPRITRNFLFSLARIIGELILVGISAGLLNNIGVAIMVLFALTYIFYTAALFTKN